MTYQERDEGGVWAEWWRKEEQTLSFLNKESAEEALVGAAKPAI